MGSSNAASGARSRGAAELRLMAGWLVRAAARGLALSAGLEAETSSAEADRMIESIGRGHRRDADALPPDAQPPGSRRA